MKKSYFKIIWREFKSSFGRFAAIFGIVALGVGFLSGLLVTTPDMHYSVDEYYDKYSMADIFIKATMGLTEDDLEEVKKVENVKDIMPAHVIDTIIDVDKKTTLVAKVYGIPILDGDESENINRLELINGRMPKNTRECLVERKSPFIEEIKIGSKVKISRENKDYDDIGDIFQEKEYRVVGIVGNSFHFSLEREISNVGSGKLGTIMYVDSESYALEDYTDFYIVAKDTGEMNTFSPEYEDYIDEITADIEKIADNRSLIRRREVIDKANEELQEGYDEYYEGKDQADLELEEGLKEINKGRRELDLAFSDLKDGEKRLKDARKTLEKENNKAKKDLNMGERELEDARLSLIKGEKELELAKRELENGQREYEKGYKEYKKGKEELDKGIRELEAAERDLIQGQREISKGREELERGIIDSRKGKTELEKAEKSYEEGIIQLRAGKKEFLDGLSGTATLLGFPSAEALISTPAGKIALEAALMGEPGKYQYLIGSWDEIKKNENQLSQAKASIAEGWKDYYSGLDQLRLAERELDQAERDIKDGKREIEKNKTILEAGKIESQKGLKELENAKAELDKGRISYKSGLEEIQEGWKEYKSGIREIKEGNIRLESETKKALEAIKAGEEEIKQGLKELKLAEIELDNAVREYDRIKVEVADELNEAYVEIKDAEEEIRDLDIPEWYVLDRNSNMSYVSFVLNADKVAAIAKVFPIFFYLVAGLVALTTMTRMVEEERGQIGVLKALGYKRTTIIFKYILYCGLASILGSIAGQLVGFKLIPLVIWNAYGVMYHLPKFVTDYNMLIALLSSGMAIISTLAATYFSASGALKEKPAFLMLPKPPKKGKRILLERIKPLWSIMSFNLKSTARNIFRYKKHFYMTVIGVSGCTALLVAGFGLRDSIKDVGDLQFDQLFKYELEVELEEDYSSNKIKQIVDSQSEVTQALEVFSDNGNIIFNDKSVETILVAVDDIEDISEYILFRDREKAKIIEPSRDKIVISEKIAQVLKVKEGDTILYENSDDIKREFRVDAITENYIRNYIYMEKSIYEKAFKDKQGTNKILVMTEELDSDQEDRLIKDFYQNEGVISAEFISQSRGMFDNLIGSINYIVLVIIVASGMLAFIVLYNLTNININERRRELATLKVLGFHNSEVSSYIFREISILAFIGTMVGLLLGKYLHLFIVVTVEDPAFMFGRDVRILSYMISGAITLFFSGIVDIFMAKKIKNIKMVDSLKAND